MNSKPQVIDLLPKEFNQLSNQPLLIDVRSNFEYRLFHAASAINLSLPRILMSSNSWLRPWVVPQWFQELPKDEPVALICLTAHRSPIAAETLIKNGFNQVYNIRGGMMKWQQLGLPTCQGE
jgi:rhodanese-related sulfurtransferase